MIGECNFLDSVCGNDRGILYRNKSIYIELNEKTSGFATPINGKDYAIAFAGEIHNKDELMAVLKPIGFTPRSTDELLLLCYYVSGVEFLSKLRGTFAIAIYDGGQEHLVLARDQMGIMPLFYTIGLGIKFCLELGRMAEKESEVDTNGLREIFGIGPARTPGTTAFKNIKEIKPGHFAIYSRSGFTQEQYWSLRAVRHTDTSEVTVAKIREMVCRSVNAQVGKDTCSLLSGGIDSTVVTAIAADYMRQTGKTLSTFSFDYIDNSRHFVPSDFQPQEDRPYVEKAVAALGTNHTFLEIDTSDLLDNLYTAVDAKGLPGMGDIDSSILAFLKKIKPTHGSFLTGEGADEVFGGYPWFRRPELTTGDIFPWSRNIEVRESFLEEELRKILGLKEYTEMRYKESLSNAPLQEGETDRERRLRQVYYLNTQWFMSTLVDRTQRAAYFLGMYPRMPYANVDMVEYVYNVPWSIKTENGIIKYPLRKAFEGRLPQELVYRKKSPFPKTYNPSYTNALAQRLKDEVLQPNAPIFPFIDPQKVMNLHTKDAGPWFGQLMQGPQQMAYLIQVNYWLKKFNVEYKAPIKN